MDEFIKKERDQVYLNLEREINEVFLIPSEENEETKTKTGTK